MVNGDEVEETCGATLGEIFSVAPVVGRSYVGSFDGLAGTAVRRL